MAKTSENAFGWGYSVSTHPTPFVCNITSVVVSCGTLNYGYPGSMTIAIYDPSGGVIWGPGGMPFQSEPRIFILSCSPFHAFGQWATGGENCRIDGLFLGDDPVFSFEITE